MKLTLISTKAEASDVRTFVFKPEVAVTYLPGQYFQYTLEHENPDDRGVKRWFTNSGAPFEEVIRISTRFSGDKGSSFKRALFNLKEGNVIDATGPEGDFVVTDLSKKYIFIAGGIGITPFRSILLQLDHDKKQIDVDLIYGNRNEEFIFESELNQIAMIQPKFRMHKLVEPNRVDEEAIRKVVTDLLTPMFYISGPKPMVDSLQTLLISMGVNKERIMLDDFPGYDK
jgi:ferredoxin-NADP reductase